MPLCADVAPPVADRASYVGSGEHKRAPNPLCPPSLRTDASDCDAVDPTISQDLVRLNRWLREAIRRGQVDRVLEGAFPRFAWAWVVVGSGARQLFEARLTNREAGQYKGYFIEMDDMLGKKAWARRKLVEGGEWWEALP